MLPLKCNHYKSQLNFQSIAIYTRHKTNIFNELATNMFLLESEKLTKHKLHNQNNLIESKTTNDTLFYSQNQRKRYIYYVNYPTTFMLHKLYAKFKYIFLYLYVNYNYIKKKKKRKMCSKYSPWKNILWIDLQFLQMLFIYWYFNVLCL